MTISITHQNGTHPARAFHKTNVLPPLDVYENQEELLVVVDVPGATKDTLSILVEGGLIKFEAKVPEVEAQAGNGKHAYERSLRIPPGIDGAKISAEIKNGLLVLHMPKEEQAKPRKIPIKAT